MPAERKKKGASAVTEAYPTGPVLLGELVDALNVSITPPSEDISDESRDRDRSTYRALAGDVVEESAVLNVCTLLGSALIDKGIVPRGDIHDAKAVVSFAIYALVRQWNFATQEHRVGLRKPLDWRVMTLAAAQLFAIDLAIRTGAWLALLDTSMDIPEQPLPCMATAIEAALRGTGKSQPKLAAELHVDDTTLYRWRKGKARPSDANLDELAPHLCGTVALGTPVGSLRRQLTAAAILERLADSIDEADIEDLWRMFARTTNRTVAFLRKRPPDAAARRLWRELVLFGAGMEPARDLIRELCEQESEFRWLAPLDSVRDWNARLEFAQGIAWRAAVPISQSIAEPTRTLLVNFALAEATQAIDQLASLWSGKHPDLAPLFRCNAHLVHAAIAKRRHDHDAVVAHLRAANELSSEPSIQERVLTGLMEVADLDAAITHAASSKSVTGANDARMIWAVKEIAEGRVLDGRDELERLVKEGGDTGELLLYLGAARWRCDDFGAALEILERVLELPEFQHHALAHDIASECAFRVGNEKRGLELARRANRLGNCRMYIMWHLAQLSTASTGE